MGFETSATVLGQVVIADRTEGTDRTEGIIYLLDEFSFLVRISIIYLDDWAATRCHLDT